MKSNRPARVTNSPPHGEISGDKKKKKEYQTSSSPDPQHDPDLLHLFGEKKEGKRVFLITKWTENCITENS